MKSATIGPTAAQKRLQEIALWIQQHQERFWTIVGFVVVVGVFAAFAVRHRQLQNEEGWNQLGPIQSQIMQSQYDAAKKALADWKTKYAGTSADAYQQFLTADLLYRTSDYAQAAQVYGTLAATARPDELKPLALSAQASATEMAGRLPEARAAAASFTDRYPDHFLAASNYLAQARIDELLADKAAAAAVYDRYLILYPQSPWTAFARARSQALGGAPPKPAVPVGQ